MSELSDLYQTVILDHNKHPRNRGKIPQATRVASGDNPTCGDNCTVYLRMDGERIDGIGFEGAGCAISQASASVMTTQVKGKTLAEVREQFEGFKHLVTTGEEPEEFAETAAFAGVHAFPARIKCATLSWHATLDALQKPDEPVA